MLLGHRDIWETCGAAPRDAAQPIERPRATALRHLAFARAIVEAHGGRIAFRSAAGKGSTFWIELPRAGTAA